MTNPGVLTRVKEGKNSQLHVFHCGPRMCTKCYMKWFQQSVDGDLELASCKYPYN